MKNRTKGPLKAGHPWDPRSSAGCPQDFVGSAQQTLLLPGFSSSALLQDQGPGTPPAAQQPPAACLSLRLPNTSNERPCPKHLENQAVGKVLLISRFSIGAFIEREEETSPTCPPLTTRPPRSSSTSSSSHSAASSGSLEQQPAADNL
jgi:hypothetical protein